MARRVKASTIKHTARHVRRQSGTIRHLRLKVTVIILVILLCVLGIYAVVTKTRTVETVGGVEVVVGSNLMARIPMDDLQSGMPVLDALDEVAIRPTSQQVIIITGRNNTLEITAAQAGEYTFFVENDVLKVMNETGTVIEEVLRVYLPTDESSIKRLD